MKDPLCAGIRAGQCWSQASCLFWCSLFWLHRLLPPPLLLPPQWTTLPPARVCSANCSFRAEEAGWENELREQRAPGGGCAREAGRQAGAEGRRTIGNQRTPGLRAAGGRSPPGARSLEESGVLLSPQASHCSWAPPPARPWGPSLAPATGDRRGHSRPAVGPVSSVQASPLRPRALLPRGLRAVVGRPALPCSHLFHQQLPGGSR